MQIPATLRNALLNGQCVPFIGAGVSIAVKRSDGSGSLFPSWRDLLLKSADRLDSEGKPAEASLVRSLLQVEHDIDYLYAASRAKRSLGAVWYNFLAEELNPPADSADPATLELARMVWNLNSKLVVTTNFDRVLNWTCPDSKNLQTWSIEAPAEMIAASKLLIRPVVWHLHGTIGDATNLIITPDGYSRLYPSDTSKPSYKAALHSLQSLLAGKTLLFIGFSGHDQHFGKQLQDMAEIFKMANGPHYIVIHTDEVSSFRTLGLPVEPITFKEYGLPHIEALATICSITDSLRALNHPAKDSISHLESTQTQSIQEEGNELIQEINKKFPQSLVALESNVTEWNSKLVSEFREQLRPETKIDCPDTLTDREFLQRIGCLQNGRLSYAGVLMFTAKPAAASSTVLSSAITQCVKYEGTTKSAKRTREQFSGSILRQMIHARDFIARNVKSTEKPSPESMAAKRSYDYPMVCIRELIANAICHRDYRDQDRMTYVRIFSDRIEISSPGVWPILANHPIGGIALNRLGSQSIQSNLALSHLVSMVSVVEMEGSGLPSSVRDCLDNDAPIPHVQHENGYVMVTIYPCAVKNRFEVDGLKKPPIASKIDTYLTSILEATEQAEDEKLMSLYTNLASAYYDEKLYSDSLAAANAAIEISNRITHHSRAFEARFIHTKAIQLLNAMPNFKS